MAENNLQSVGQPYNYQFYLNGIQTTGQKKEADKRCQSTFGSGYGAESFDTVSLDSNGEKTGYYCKKQ